MNPYVAFIKIIETGSFTKAAEELGYTQSAISQMIHSLEEELSTTLILRSRKGVTLTSDGEEFLPFIRNIRNSHQELIEKHNEMQCKAWKVDLFESERFRVFHAIGCQD